MSHFVDMVYCSYTIVYIYGQYSRIGICAYLFCKFPPTPFISPNDPEISDALDAVRHLSKSAAIPPTSPRVGGGRLSFRFVLLRGSLGGEASLHSARGHCDGERGLFWEEERSVCVVCVVLCVCFVCCVFLCVLCFVM